MSPLEEITRRTCWLCDFDGVIASLFAVLQAPSVADSLRAKVAGMGFEVPAEIMFSDDPFDVFRFAGRKRIELAKAVQAELATWELCASRTAEAVPHAHEVVQAAKKAGRTLAVVSNNSPEAVLSYLRTTGLAPSFTTVIGRTDPDPGLLKPSGHLVRKAIRALGADPVDCVLIDDSVSGIEAAHGAGIPVIKVGPFVAEDADANIRDMAELLPFLNQR